MNAQLTQSIIDSYEQDIAYSRACALDYLKKANTTKYPDSAKYHREAAYAHKNAILIRKKHIQELKTTGKRTV